MRGLPYRRASGRVLEVVVEGKVGCSMRMRRDDKMLGFIILLIIAIIIFG